MGSISLNPDELLERWSVETSRQAIGDVEIYRHEIGRFRKKGFSISKGTFSEIDAEILAQLLVLVTRRPSERVGICLYPYFDETWKELTSDGWTSLVCQEQEGGQPWRVGLVEDEDRLAAFVLWAWWLPGRETLLFLPLNVGEVTRLVAEYRHGADQDEDNEWKLIESFSEVFSRGWSSTNLRWFSRTVDEAEVNRLLKEAVTGAISRFRRKG